MRAAILALVLAIPGLALAQDPPPAAHTHVLGVVHIVGRRPTPVTLFVPRARMHFDRTDAAHHSVDRIVESVTHAPF